MTSIASRLKSLCSGHDEAWYAPRMQYNDFVINSLISIFPNPSDGEINVELDLEGKTTVKVYNQIGKLLYNNEIDDYKVAEFTSFLTGLNEGLYLINVIGEEKNQTIKYIKY